MKSLSNLIKKPERYNTAGFATIPSDDGKYIYYYLQTYNGKFTESMRWAYFLSSVCTEKRKVQRQKWKLRNQIIAHHQDDSVSFD